MTIMKIDVLQIVEGRHYNLVLISDNVVLTFDLKLNKAIFEIREDVETNFNLTLNKNGNEVEIREETVLFDKMLELVRKFYYHPRIHRWNRKYTDRPTEEDILMTGNTTNIRMTLETEYPADSPFCVILNRLCGKT